MNQDLNRFHQSILNLQSAFDPSTPPANSSINTTNPSTSPSSLIERVNDLVNDWRNLTCFYGSTLDVEWSQTIERSLEVLQASAANQSTTGGPKRKKKKFAFASSESNAIASTSSSVSSISSTLPVTSPSPLLRSQSSAASSSPCRRIKQRQSQYITWDDEAFSLLHADTATTASDIGTTTRSTISLELEELSNCFINLVPTSPNLSSLTVPPRISISALYLTNLCDSIIVLADYDKNEGQTMSALVRNCVNCWIILGCHQLRIHDSHHCTISLSSDRGAIIERCESIRFGNYPFSGKDTPSESKRQYSFNEMEIKDFDFPFATSTNPSPNYTLLSDSTDSSMCDMCNKLVECVTETGAQGHEQWKEVLTMFMAWI